MTTMLLHASKLSFIHPVTGQPIEMEANVHGEFQRVLNLMNWNEEPMNKDAYL